MDGGGGRQCGPDRAPLCRGTLGSGVGCTSPERHAWLGAAGAARGATGGNFEGLLMVYDGMQGDSEPRTGRGGAGRWGLVALLMGMRASHAARSKQPGGECRGVPLAVLGERARLQAIVGGEEIP